MYLNLVTEMIYVGASLYGLEYRHRQHLKAASLGKSSRFYRALFRWPDWAWERVVLERCSTVEELDAAEKRWVDECSAMDDGVGYNTYDARYLKTAIAGGEAMKAREFSPAERESLSKRGKLGADKNEEVNGHTFVNKKKRESFAALSEEEQRDFFRQCGQKGAEHGKKGARRREDMSEEEREKYREWGRKGALASKKLKAEQV